MPHWGNHHAFRKPKKEPFLSGDNVPVTNDDLASSHGVLFYLFMINATLVFYLWPMMTVLMMFGTFSRALAANTVGEEKAQNK